ncbi:microfibril-associated glycoprotein 4-like isoform X1 [Uranotaenia lowii]|uniref:microfibril-associated glycoprotein 4-like isoform X1 n=2 Tax=Uranotaenia lowii TaxID=190385 RepID=UPI00247AC0FC|nr:microfibril-associated glycoprotein 4-like isoform X1 [Uranotaenia lowii]
MLIKQLNLRFCLVALVLCGLVPKSSSVFGYELFESSSLDTIKLYLQNISQSLSEHHQTYRTDIEELRRNMKSTEDLGNDIKQLLQNTAFPQTCSDIPKMQTGVYRLKPQAEYQSFEALCDFDYPRGGWTVIQNRFNGSVDFYRGWKDYEEGFGDLRGEFWLGLEKIHQLTYSKPHELHVLLNDFEGKFVVAKYDYFRVADKAEHYTLKNLGLYSGKAGDGLSEHLHKKFSTFDVDNDSWERNCAIEKTGAWWYGDFGCHTSNLNGRYLGQGVKANDTGMSWDKFRGPNVSLKSSRMMIRVRV